MDYQYRRKAYAILAEQRTEMIEECKQEYKRKKPDKIDTFLKGIMVSIIGFFSFINDKL